MQAMQVETWTLALSLMKFHMKRLSAYFMILNLIYVSPIVLRAFSH